MLNSDERRIVNDFFRLYYHGSANYSPPWGGLTLWQGIPCLKCPLDLWIYQEILYETRPDLIIETGTYSGGSALYLAQLCELIGHGRVVSIDLIAGERPAHPRIQYVCGSSTAPELVRRIVQSDSSQESRMVILDSDHHAPHVLAEMELLGPLVTRGQYLVVEDSCVNGNPILPEFGPGPLEAIQEFLRFHPEFVVDESREKFLLTLNPQGFLKRLT